MGSPIIMFQIIATVCRVVGSVSDGTDTMKLLASNSIFSRITSYSSETVMKNEMMDFCGKAKSLISQSRKRDSEVLCDRVMQIIDENYSDENLSLTGVSNTLAVSPNYLSALIKKTKKKKKLKKKLSEYLKRGKAVARPLAVTIKRVNEIVRGWINYFRIGIMKQFLKELGE